MNEDEVRALVEELVAEKLGNILNSLNIPYHTHDGINSPLVDGENIKFRVITAAPTDTPQNGTLRLALIGGIYYIEARIAGVWKKVAVA